MVEESLWNQKSPNHYPFLTTLKFFFSNLKIDSALSLVKVFGVFLNPVYFFHTTLPTHVFFPASSFVVSYLWIAVLVRGTKSGITCFHLGEVTSLPSFFIWLTVLQNLDKKVLFPGSFPWSWCYLDAQDTLCTLHSLQQPILSLFCSFSRVWVLGSMGPCLTDVVALVVLIPVT